LKRIRFSDDAKADIRAIPQHIAMNILTAIHRLAEHGSGNVKNSWAATRPSSACVSAITVSASLKTTPTRSTSTPSKTARTLTAEKTLPIIYRESGSQLAVDRGSVSSYKTSQIAVGGRTNSSHQKEGEARQSAAHSG
jgi:hypothetical protein